MKNRMAVFVIAIVFIISAVACKKRIVADDTATPAVSSKASHQRTAMTNNPNTQHEIAVNSAMSIFKSDGNGKFTEFKTMGGTKPFETCSALATLGIELSKGNRNSALVNKYVEVVKQVVSNISTTHHLRPSGGLICREQNGAFVGIALGWRQADIKARFTTAEQARIITLMKAGLVSTAFVMAKYTSDGVKRGNRVVDMEGDSSIYESPNYSEGYAGVFLAATTVIGKNSIYSFLNNYKHDAFVAELKAAKFNSTVYYFNKTFNQTVNGIVYDASDALKKAALIESYVRYIDNNDNMNRPFYNGLKLSDITSDPVKLTYTLTMDCYNKTATEGQFAGRLGMAQELKGADASGVRSSTWYSAAGMINNTYSRYLLEDYGYWAASGESGMKNEIDKLMQVGWTDIAPKSWNGYWSRRKGTDAYDHMVPHETGVSWWQRAYNLARMMGRVKEYYMSDDFDDADYTMHPAWTATSGTWTFATPATFTGITQKPDTVIQTSADEFRSRLISNFKGSDYEMTVQCKINKFGASDPEIGLIGRYVDANNFYIAKYNKSTSDTKIIEVKNNVWTTLATSPTTFSLKPNDLYFLKIAFTGNKIDFYINNDLKVSATSDSFTYGSTGLFAKYTKVYFDDVFVTKPSFDK